MMDEGERRRRGVRRIVRGAIELEEEFGPGLLSAGAFVVFAIIFVPVGIVAFLGTFAVVMGVGFALGATAEPAGTVVLYGGLFAAGAVTFVLFRAIYRRLPRRVVQIANDPAAFVGFPAEEEPPETLPPAHAMPAPSGSGPTLAELDARLALSAVPGAPAASVAAEHAVAWAFPASSSKLPATAPARDRDQRESSTMGPWVDRAAMAAGVVVGVAFGQGVAAVASAGSLWQVELPLVVGGIAALLVWIRTKRHVLQAAALGFLCACAVVALLFLGAT